LSVQVNGKVRAEILITVDEKEEVIKENSQKLNNFKFLSGENPKR